MAITHARVVVAQDRGLASDWNDDHVVDDDSKPKNDTTLIVAASNSLDTSRADYVCDGVDDQDEINAALNALPAQGGRVSLLEGTFQLTAGIVIPDDNVSIEGLGSNTVLQTAGDIKMISAVGRDGLMIGSLKLVGKGVLSAAQFGIEFDTCTDSRILDVWLEDQGASAIYLKTCEFIKVTDCFTNNNILVGTYVENCDYCVILNCTSNANGAINDGFYLTGCTYCALIGCLADGNADGIDLANVSNHNTISGCFSINNGNTGIRIKVGCDRNNIINNMATGNGINQINDLGANNDVAHNQVL